MPEALPRTAGRPPDVGGALPPRSTPTSPDWPHVPRGAEGHWLTQRIATTHDIHPVVSGFDTRPVGEIGVLAITATQIGFPAYVLLNAAMARVIAHGTSNGFSAAPLSTGRWEEGWELPVAEWRRRLGIQHPANDETYGLQLAEA